MIEAILTVNAGSSSLKYGVFESAPDLACKARGEIAPIGADSALSVEGEPDVAVEAQDLEAAIGVLQDWLAARGGDWSVRAVAHRIVHGGARFTAPVAVDDAVLGELDALSPLAPLHQPANLAAVRALRDTYRHAAHVGCFDTAFHATMGRMAQSFALPEAYFARGVRRYGFHGLSYEWVRHRLTEEHPDLAGGRVIAAHLGGGASLCALQAGVSIATTMSMTALDGVPMGSRPGAIDPGAVLFLVRELGIEGAEQLLYKGAGLKGLSGLSGDVRVLRASADPAARFALDYFVDRTAAAVAALTASLGGLDALVFTGGIGANDAQMRADITARLAHLKPFQTLILKADEEWIMARHALAFAAARPLTSQILPQPEG